MLDLVSTRVGPGMQSVYLWKLLDAEGCVCRNIVMMQDPILVLPQITSCLSVACNQVDKHFFVEVLAHSLPFRYKLVVKQGLVVTEGNEHDLDPGLGHIDLLFSG